MRGRAVWLMVAFAAWPASLAQGQVVGAGSLAALIGAQVRGPANEPVFGGIGSFGFVAGRFFLGPEFGLVQGAKTRARILGFVARASFRGSSGRVRPFLVVGAGSYGWSSRSDYALPTGGTVAQWAGVSFLSGSLGGGAEVGSGATRTTVFELRYHGILQRTGYPPVSRGLLTAGVGVRFRW